MPVCDHRLLEFPSREAVAAEIAGKAHVFCCGGCRGVFELVHAEGSAPTTTRAAGTNRARR